MVGLRSLLPASSDRALYARIFFLDIVDGICIEEIATRGLRPKTELLIELAEYVVNYLFLRLLIKHPNAEILCLVLGLELGTRKAEKRKTDLIPVLLMLLLSELYNSV